MQCDVQMAQQPNTKNTASNIDINPQASAPSPNTVKANKQLEEKAQPKLM